MSGKRALFLDRDGTLVKDAHYLNDPEKIEIIEGVGQSLSKVRDAGYLLFMHTNQSGVSRGYFEIADVEACNSKMHQVFGWSADFFKVTCIAPELPEETGGYRKPSPRFENEMTLKYDLELSSCWVIGDKWIDAETGLLAGMRGALVRSGKPIENSIELLALESRVPIYADVNDFISGELAL